MRPIVLVCLSFVLSISCSTTRKSTSYNNTITNIENHLYTISASGKETGTAQTVPQRMAALGIKGMSVAVFDEGKIIWTRCYGLRNEHDAIDSATVFQAASISKPLTSMAMLRLWENGLFSLDTDVNQYLKKWKIPENEFTAQDKVTIRRIISHMAGLTVHGFAGYRPQDSLPNLTQILDGSPPANSQPVRVYLRPGIKESYSGGGFTILQLLIEEITGKPFASAMEELIIKPVDMRHSQFSIQLPDRMKANAAAGYFSIDKMVDGEYRRYPEQAAAGLWTTPSDLARFMLAVGDSYRGVDSNSILKPSTAQEVLQKIPGGGGLGFGVDGRGDSLRYRHSGGNAGFSCYAVAFANKGRGVVIMTNSNDGTAVIREYLRSISREYKWPPMWNRE
ncbi:serine hydrolase domain-containing protein [Chitinophaga filiformis]|uniref:CubicO group peptidase, beta-lactamase class C family n=1 Tax=Chitinophaga filiformis TaxID=104663 RepID=A0A1G7J342_CHIFI|nr:serine hydrolase domain-containing protein [Chitinophaga filiformis]SDF18929.1 CubicO group peptidase, beta-lactamase class C family [Chitinophaga filiformis]